MYETLLDLAYTESVLVQEKLLPGKIKGLYADNVIWLNKSIETQIEKGCILAEEMGHHFTSSGDITNLKLLENSKQEIKARSWAYEYMSPFEKIIKAYNSGIRDKYDLADYLDIDVSFLEHSISRYKERFGICIIINENYIVHLDPLNVIEIS